MTKRLFSFPVFARAAMLALFLLSIASPSLRAQANPDMAGVWQGTWEADKPLRIVLKISKSESGLHGVFYSIDSDTGSHGRDVGSIALQGASVKFAIVPVAGSYEGKLNAEATTIAGIWTQRKQAHTLNLTRVTPETAWEIPRPGALMVPTADPAFEVSTVRLSDPDKHNSGIHGVGQHPMIENEKIRDLLAFAYGVHPKQILGAPDWLTSGKYDIDGVLDADGQPDIKQLETIVRKVLADRFQLRVHREQKEQSVYALTMAKGGSKLVKSLGDPNGPPDGSGSNMGVERVIRFTNATLGDMTINFQFYLDRPVVDQTGLVGRFDSLLRWTPDEVVASGADAPPGLFTAIQEQLGLKLDVVTAPADMVVIDHIERPSAN